MQNHNSIKDEKNKNSLVHYQVDSYGSPMAFLKWKYPFVLSKEIIDQCISGFSGLYTKSKRNNMARIFHFPQNSLSSN